MQYYAHVRTSEPDGEPVYQTVTAHLMGTAALCRAFAADFGAANEGEMAGLAHDIGKYTPGFQHRLLDNGPIVDHATAGAIACARQNHGLIAACVAGHHGGHRQATRCVQLRQGQSCRGEPLPAAASEPVGKAIGTLDADGRMGQV